MVLRLLLILIAFVVLLRLLGWRPSAQRRAPAQTPPAATPDGDLVRCARCDLHLPRQQALARDGAWFCSPEHRDST